MAAEDPYVYSGTDILRNRLGIREAAELAAQEATLSSIRIAQLERRFIPGDYDLAHLKATHGYIFGEMYSWAGELRTVRIAKGGDLFALPEHVGPYLTTLLADLARENSLQGLEREQFVERLTHYYAEINAVHPFREGNGRARRPARPAHRHRQPGAGQGAAAPTHQGHPRPRPAQDHPHLPRRRTCGLRADKFNGRSRTRTWDLFLIREAL